MRIEKPPGTDGAWGLLCCDVKARSSWPGCHTSSQTVQSSCVSPGFKTESKIRDRSASTAVWLQADTDKLIVAAPTQINMIVQADGTMTGPSAAATQIKNGSAFGIHVSKIQTTAKNSFALESTAKANDSASVTITPGAGTAVNLADTLSGMAITSGTDWNMAKMGATGADINLATVGKLSNITKDLAANQQFAQIDWTFAAGNTK